MRLIKKAALLVVVASTTPVWAADINRRIIAEVDPVAPASSAYEQKVDNITTSKWGGNVDFNMAGVVSTGPELWTGNFTVKGPEDGQSYRREDFWPGERQKLDAIRLRWMITAWEMPQSMRGWYVKAGYSYLRINSRANRIDEAPGEGNALPNTFNVTTVGDDTSLTTDIRHGVAAGFGNRWLLMDQKLSINLGVSFTSNFKRSVSVDSKDPNARSDYDHIVEALADTRMSVKPMPEANLGFGYAW